MVIKLHEHEDLEQLLERSKTSPILIFKHSTQCPVSSSVYDEFVGFTEKDPEVTCGLVLVIEDRDISDEVATTLGVRHQSPQAIIVENGRPRWAASHWAITTDALHKAIKG